MVTKKYKIAGKHVEHNDSTSQALFLGGGRTEKSDGKHDKFWAKRPSNSSIVMEKGSDLTRIFTRELVKMTATGNIVHTK